MTSRTWRVASAIYALCCVACPHDEQRDAGAQPDTESTAPYALFAVQPATARVSDTITLEGTFGNTVTVTFPGGASVAASIIGPHRASVVVPASATADALTVTTDSWVVGPQAFQAAAFPLGLDKAEANLEQTDAAREMPSLVTARHDHASVVIGHHVYVIGGADSLQALASVERATASADGSLGQFRTLPDATLVVKRRGPTAVALGRYLYVIGGAGETSVERAAIHSDGSLDKFALVADVALPVPREGAASAVIGNTLYLLGGKRGDEAESSVLRAPIASDGSLGQFTVRSETALVVGRFGATATVVANAVYVVGGHSGSAYLKTIERAEIGNDGAIGPFAMIGAALLTGRYGHTAIMLGNALYIQGGLVAQAANNIERATVGADGSLGAFAIAPRSAMATVRTGHTSVVVGNYLYTLGGLGALGTTLSTVERAAINSGGALGALAPATGTSLKTGSESHTSAVVGDHLYVFGGMGDADLLPRVESAEIAADGSLGPFATLPRTGLSARRYRHASAVAGDHIYLIGGFAAGLGASTSEIDEAVVAADGSLGFIEPAIVSLNNARYGHTAVTIKNQLYVVGGLDSSSGAVLTVERASIAANGSLGPFALGGNLSAARHGHTSVVLGNFLCNVGGWSGDTVLANVECAPINADGSLGPFAVVSGPTLGTPRAFHASVVVGHYLYVFGGENTAATLDSVERAAIRADGTLEAFVPLPGVKLTTARVGPTAVALSGQVYVLGGRGGSRLTSVERALLGAGDAL